MQYLTPAQLRARSPLDLSGQSDAQLASAIDRASAAADAYCNVPTIPVPHSLLGGTIVRETHTWHIDPYSEQQRRVFPYHRPLIECTRFQIFATPTQYLDISPDELYYEQSEGWLEPASASLTSYGLFGSAILPFVGLTMPHVELDYSYGRLTPVLERLYQEADTAVWRGGSSYWTDDPITVTVNGTAADEADYTIDRTEGTISWTANQPPGDSVVEAGVITRQPPGLATAIGLISSVLISDRVFLEAGIPLSVTSFKVAEVSVDRQPRRVSGQRTDTAAVAVLPPEAEALLAPYRYYPAAWA